MLAFQSVEYYKNVLNLLKKLSETFSFFEDNIPHKEKNYILKNILDSYKTDDANNYIYKISKKELSNGEMLKNYQNCFVNFNNTFKFYEFYKLVSEIELEYKRICKDYNYTDESVKDFIFKLNDFSKLHETLIMGSNQNSDKVNFFEESEKIIREFAFLIKSISCYISSITNYEISELDENNQALNIQLLDINYNVKEFYEILSNIDDAYSIIGMFTTETKETLKINKIESGSMLADIFGNGIIISITIYLLKKIIDIVYNKYSESGKVDLIGREIKTISESAETYAKLQELGIEVNEENKKKIGECLIAAVDKLHKVVVRAPKIIINGKQYSVADAQKYLEYSQKLLDVEISTKNDEEK